MWHVDSCKEGFGMVSGVEWSGIEGGKGRRRMMGGGCGYVGFNVRGSVCLF